MIDAPFICEVAAVTDGDTFRCADGRRIRIVGVDANERDGTCHTTCAPMEAGQADAWLDRLIYRQRLTCRQVDVSYRRIVATCTLPDGRSLSCAVVAAGAAVVWPAYWRRYGLGACRG